MLNITKCTQLLNNVLEQVGILDVIKKDSSIYVGGSLPSFIVSQCLGNKEDKIVCNDIDLYTTNYVKTLHNITKYLGNKMTLIKRTGVNVTFMISDIPVQIVTSEFDSFYTDVLGNYDCTLVSIGYYPYNNEVIIHDNFLNCLNNKTFICYHERSNPKRIIKLTDRAKAWYDCELKVIKETENGDFRPYYKGTHSITSLQDIISPPNYVQLYYNKHKCVQCGVTQEYLLCKQCFQVIDYNLTTKNQTRNKKITILGGVNGFGKILAEIAKIHGNDVNVTTRNPLPDSKNTYKFVLGDPVSDELMECILTSDIVVLNAYSTLENDESIWLTTLDTFNEKLSYDKFAMNTIGYVRFLKEFVKKRKEHINKHNLDKDIMMVFMDANESLFEGKLMDGKHLELNLAKTATKQIFYTNANLLGSLGVLTICFNVNWLSYHGISVDKIESKSKFLIPPSIAANCMLYLFGKTNFDDFIEKKKPIFDSSVYEIIKEFK